MCPYTHTQEEEEATKKEIAEIKKTKIAVFTHIKRWKKRNIAVQTPTERLKSLKTESDQPHTHIIDGGGNDDDGNSSVCNHVHFARVREIQIVYFIVR